MADAPNKFVEELSERLDPLTSLWLLPLDPLLSVSYRHRFRTSDQKPPEYLVYDAMFVQGQRWMTAFEFYARSRDIACALRHHLAPPEGASSDCDPTGWTSTSDSRGPSFIG